MTPQQSTLRLAERMSVVAPSPMLTLAAYAASLRAQGRDILSLATGEPDFNTPEHIQAAAIAAMQSGDTHYTPADGTKALKEAVVRKFARENGLDYKIDEISIGTGAKQVIFNAFAATIDTGDEVIFAAPYYPSYLEMTKLNGGVPVVVQTTMAEAFKLQPEALARVISARTKWLVLNSPSNPTGGAYTTDEMRALADVLLRHPHVWVLCDDIYEHLLFSDIAFTTMAAVEPRLRNRTLTVNGVSKAYCMTGWRIGYAGGPAALIRAMATVQSQVTSCPSSVSQAAACAALDGPVDVLNELRSVFQTRRDRIVGLLNDVPGLRCPVPDGAFYVFPTCGEVLGRKANGKVIATDANLATYLLETVGVAVIPGSSFGTENHFRISYAASMEQLEEACRRISRAIAALTN
jgi:aspartate aminotransferase